MNFEEIIQAKKERGCTVADLIVLARNNDPFYVGTNAHKRDATWFTEIWERFGYRDGVHLRRIHYRLVSQKEPVVMPSGLPYENTEACWSFLAAASKYARWLKMVDPGAFDDRRNGKPEIFHDKEEVFAPCVTVSDDWNWGFETPDLPDLPGYELHGFKPEQRYHVEVWCEKSTMNDVLEPACQSLKANLVTGLGEQSLTSCLRLVERVKEYGKPCRIFYLSDFDPAGQSMPVATARKIEKYIDDFGAPDMDIKLMPLILSHEQCLRYELPRTPIKESERRAARFETRFGQGATELDALEALHPGELRHLLREAISRYRDDNLYERIRALRNAIAEDLGGVREAVIAGYREEIAEIEAAYAALRHEFSGRFGEIRGRILSVWQTIQTDLEANAPDVTQEYMLPEPDYADETDGALFDSMRDYFDQLKAFKDFQGRCAKAVTDENAD